VIELSVAIIVLGLLISLYSLFLVQRMGRRPRDLHPAWEDERRRVLLVSYPGGLAIGVGVILLYLTVHGGV
jgi:hypothetical protein